MINKCDIIGCTFENFGIYESLHDPSIEYRERAIAILYSVATLSYSYRIFLVYHILWLYGQSQDVGDSWKNKIIHLPDLGGDYNCCARPRR